jgi:hypothetical protein
VQRVTGQIGLTGPVVELAEDALAQRSGMGGVVDAHPQVDTWGLRAVDDLDDHDLAVVVRRQVDGAVELVAKRLQGSAGTGGRTGRTAVAQDDVEPVAEHVCALVQAPQVSLVGQRPQQVVGRRKRQPGRAGQLLGVRTTSRSATTSSSRSAR